MILADLQINHKKYIPLHFEYKKIKDFNESDYKSLYGYLVKLCEMSGVNKPTNDILKSVIVFLKDAYGDFSEMEIQTAFNMAFSHQLNIDDVSNYGSLNVIWISKILQAYKLNRGKALSDYETKRREIEFEKSQEKSQEEINRYMSEAVISNFEKFKLNKKFSDMGNSIFNFLTRVQLLPLTDEEKKSLMVEANKRLLDNSLNNDRENVFTRALSSLKDGIPANISRIMARDIAVEKRFEKWIDNNVDPKVLLKKYL